MESKSFFTSPYRELEKKALCLCSSTPSCSLNRAFDLKQGSLEGFISKTRMCPFSATEAGAFLHGCLGINSIPCV